MTLHLFLHPGSLADLQEGESVELSGPEAKHALGVHRLQPGQRCLLSDGAGTVAEVEIGQQSETGKSPVLRGRAAAVRSYEPVGIPLTLVQALAKGDRDLDAVEMCTELGMMAVMPWAAERSIVQWSGPKAAKHEQKWASQLAAAAKQSRNPFTPALLPLRSTKQLEQWVREQTEAGVLVFMLHEEAEWSLTEHLETGSAEEAAGLAFIVGPEGGISPREAQVLTAAGALPAGLGSLILRASSAGPAAAVTAQALLAGARR